MERKMRVLSIGSAVLAALLVAFATAPSAAAAPAGECVMVLGKAPAIGADSPVLMTKCAPAGEKVAVAATNTLLMELYHGYNYGGYPPLKLYGVGGPCDSGGYGIHNLGSAYNDATRSWKVFNKCLYSTAFMDADYGGYCHNYYGQVPNGIAMDNTISSFWIASTSTAWSC